MGTAPGQPWGRSRPSPVECEAVHPGGHARGAMAKGHAANGCRPDTLIRNRGDVRHWSRALLDIFVFLRETVIAWHALWSCVLQWTVRTDARRPLRSVYHAAAHGERADRGNGHIGGFCGPFNVFCRSGLLSGSWLIFLRSLWRWVTPTQSHSVPSQMVAHRWCK